jgi:nucleotide-binding universal stress UspA family protein
MTMPIVAGTDGSEESLAAVGWAAAEAARRRVPLSIVHVVEPHHALPAAHAQPPQPDRGGRLRHDLPHRARSALARASRRAAQAAPGVDLRTTAVFGRADQVLTDLAATVPLLAIGTRGAGGFPGLRLGSVALRLACGARCPVVFAPVGTAPVVGEIVVGIDDCDEATAALGFGFDEADVRGARLTALHVWAQPQAGRLDGHRDWVLSVGPVNQAAAAVLAAQVAPWRDKYPGVTVTEITVHGHPGRTLALASRGADLVVVGGCRNGLASVPGLGQLGYAMLHHAQCAVALIPGAGAA